MDCSPPGSSIHGDSPGKNTGVGSLSLLQGNFPTPSLVAQRLKRLPAMRETLGSIPGSGRSPGEGNSNPLQYSCLENPMDGGAWWATVHGVTKSRILLSDFTHSYIAGGFFAIWDSGWNQGLLHCRQILLGSEPPQKPLSHITCPDFLCVRIYWDAYLLQLWRLQTQDSSGNSIRSHLSRGKGSDIPEAEFTDI